MISMASVIIFTERANTAADLTRILEVPEPRSFVNSTDSMKIAVFWVCLFVCSLFNDAFSVSQTI
jgi:hypothetical protein